MPIFRSYISKISFCLAEHHDLEIEVIAIFSTTVEVARRTLNMTHHPSPPPGPGRTCQLGTILDKVWKSSSWKS